MYRCKLPRRGRTLPGMPALRFLPILLLAFSAGAEAERPTLATDRTWERLPPPADGGGRGTLGAAAEALGDWPLRLAGVAFDGDTLAELAAVADAEPLVRAVRERLGRPVDLADFLYLLDDLAAAEDLQGRTIYLPSGRARAAGVLLHPDDVFGGQPRRYGADGGRLAVDRPPRPADLEPAEDGDPLGPRWTARYRNPGGQEAMLTALERAGGADFARRIRLLLAQLRAQGADAWVSSTVRSRERGYLIYGSFILSRAENADEVARRAAKLDRLNRAWGLDVPIRWRHPGGWQATVQAAKAMADAYNVVYATQRGARHSSHYGAMAADFAAMGLPRAVTLTAPGGATRTFDLSDPQHPRDLNLSPALIAWVEEHFAMRKLRRDYPHWTDAAGD